MTDYMKTVIENGNYFTAESLIVALDNLTRIEMNDDFI